MWWRRRRGGSETLRERIEELSQVNRSARSPEIEHQLLRLRHL
jgi:hypothetical protein